MMVNELIEQLIRKQLRQYDQMKAALPARELPQTIDLQPRRQEQCRTSVGHHSNGNPVPAGSSEKLPVRNRGRRNTLVAKAVSGENFRLTSRSQD
jgi:hypothetical protein